MSYFSPAAKITANTQESFEYAMYMVFGSYFRKTVCKSPIKESSMRINYIETKTSLQFEMEDICESKAGKLFRCLPKGVQSECAEVSFITNSGYPTEIRFSGERFILRLIGSYRKGDSEIRAEFWNK